MAALLAPSFTERCLWQTQATPPATASELPTDVDVLVVGAGLAGLSAAATAAAAGASVLVVDKEPLGWGASSRNGGMVIPELKAGPDTLAAKYGPLGYRLHAEVDDGFRFVEALIAGSDGGAGVECDYRRAGELVLAHSPRHVAGLRAQAAELAAHGEEARFLSRVELRDEVGSEAFHGGLLLERTGALHPARFHAGMARRALAAGAVIVDRTAATAIAPDSGAKLVTTTRGIVRAREVLVLTNAAADAAVPQLARRVLPIGSFIIATVRLDPALAASVSPRGRMLVDTKNLLFYWRLTPDGRVAFGGRRSLEPVDVPTARDFLYDQMLRIHPQLRGVAVEYAWGGNVAMTLDRLPHVGSVDGCWYATGCNGSGVMMMTWLGHRLAQTVTGQAPPSAFTELRHQPIPLQPLIPSYLPLLSRWFTLQDAR